MVADGLNSLPQLSVEEVVDRTPDIWVISLGFSQEQTSKAHRAFLRSLDVLTSTGAASSPAMESVRDAIQHRQARDLAQPTSEMTPTTEPEKHLSIAEAPDVDLRASAQQAQPQMSFAEPPPLTPEQYKILFGEKPPAERRSA